MRQTRVPSIPFRSMSAKGMRFMKEGENAADADTRGAEKREKGSGIFLEDALGHPRGRN